MRGVVNLVFGGSYEVFIDMLFKYDEFKIDMDGNLFIKFLSYKGDIKIDMSGYLGIKFFFSKGDVKFDMDWDFFFDMNFMNGNVLDLNFFEGKFLDVDFFKSEFLVNGLLGGSLLGVDVDVII